MAKKEPKFYILCLSNCYFESILIAIERIVEKPRNQGITEGKRPQGTFYKGKIAIVCKSLAKDVLTVVS